MAAAGVVDDVDFIITRHKDEPMMTIQHGANTY